MQTLTQRRTLGKVRLMPDDLVTIEERILAGTDKRHSTTYRVSSHGPVSYDYDSIRALLQDDQAPARLANIRFAFMDHSANVRFDVEIRSRSGTIWASSPPDQQSPIAQKIAGIHDYLRGRERFPLLAKMYGRPLAAAAILGVLLIPYLIATMAGRGYFIISLLAAPLLIHLLLFTYYGAAANEIALRRETID